MANEVTINIESSLAAMAFVVADQQQLIKDVRETADEWKSEYYKMEEKYNECDRIRDEWSKNFEKCSAEKEKLQIKLGTLEDKYYELKQEFEDVRSDLALEKERRYADVVNLKNKLLKWHPYTQEDIGLTIEQYPRQPCVLVKREVIKDGLYDIASRSLPIGYIDIGFAFLNISEGKYKITNNDAYTNVLAWCIVGEDNFADE